MSNKIKILFLSASPTNAGRVRVDVEVREIAEKLKQGSVADSFELVQCHAVRVGDLQLHLMEHRPHIVHFSGHSSRSRKLLLEDNAGNSKPVPPDALTEIFELHKRNIKVVVLNACFTLEQAQAIGKTIDFTVGISKTIKDQSAITFAGAFYRALSFGMTFQEAFESGRVEIKAWGLRGHELLNFVVRDGVNPSQAALSTEPPVSMSKFDAWKIRLKRVVDGHSTEQETHSVRQDILEGKVLLDQVEDDELNSGEEIRVVQSLSEKISFQAEVRATTYRRIQERLYPPPPGLAPPPPGLIFIGREDSLAHFKRTLQPPRATASDVNMTVIRGWPGVGKTTLVGVLGRDPQIINAYPHGVLWTSLERQPEIIGKMAEWGRALGVEDLLRIPTVEETTARLATLLRHRQMLLIIDDVWDAAHALPFIHAAVGTRCSVLVTTRLTGVAETLTLDEEKIYRLEVLTEEAALTLLRHIIPATVEQYGQECLELVCHLECLPLALHVAGRLLKAGEKIGLSVTDLIRDIKEKDQLLSETAPPDRAEGGAIPTVQALLKKSTDMLDPVSRDCFAFLGVFAPKPATFDLEAIKAVWEMDRPHPVINNLVRYGLLEPVDSGRFQIHDLLVQHARTIID